MAEEVTRRDFVKQTAVGAAVLSTGSVGLKALEAGAETAKQVVSAMGAAFIPSKAGDPGYKDLEVHGITDYVLKEFPATAVVEAFNAGARPLFGGKSFLELDDKQREEYFTAIVDGGKISDAAEKTRLQNFYRDARRRILRVYYTNYPEHEVKRDANDIPILKPGDIHQELNPNTKRIVTGWDLAGYTAPMTWEEEQKARARAKKDSPYWDNADLARLSPTRRAPALAKKTPDGHDYYDVIVLGGGTGGCIVAGRIAERGINPKTGDRLSVAMIEGGSDWTVRDPAISPGYGQPIRRRMLTDIADGRGPENSKKYVYPGPSESNYKIVGGCSTHFGATCWMPGDEDFQFYREASGVNWDLVKFGGAIEEVRDLYGVRQPPDHWWPEADRVWCEGARALGLDVRATEGGFHNMIFPSPPGGWDRYDSKGTSLPWAYIGLNNGMKIISDAEVDKILIDKPAGGRPVAIGAVYKDKTGVMREVRAARVVVAMGTLFTPLMLFKSGYGPRELLGDKVIVENKNVGNHITGDSSFASSAYLAEPVAPPGPEDMSAEPWVAVQPRPWPEASVQIRARVPGRNPAGIAMSPFAPGFGWEHKEYMRNGFGVRHMMTWRTHVAAIPAVWRIVPDGKIELVRMDEARMQATLKETDELLRAWYTKLPIKAVKTDHRAFNVRVRDIPALHRTGTTRAGANRETSVCNNDFDCHDIDHLMFSSAAAIPRTFVWSCGPTAVNAAYAWRRMVANHFTKGSSTKGFA